MSTAYLHLGVAIVAEVIATSLLTTSARFTRFWPSVGTITGYGAAFYFLAPTLPPSPLALPTPSGRAWTSS